MKITDDVKEFLFTEDILPGAPSTTEINRGYYIKIGNFFYIVVGTPMPFVNREERKRGVRFTALCIQYLALNPECVEELTPTFR